MALVLTRKTNQSVLLRDERINDPALITVASINRGSVKLLFHTSTPVKVNRIELTSKIIDEMKMEGKKHEEIKLFIEKIKAHHHHFSDQLCQEIYYFESTEK